MASNRIFRVVLRTLDVEAARTFYRAVLDVEDFHVFPLHDQAIARGARPHWLGFFGVPDVAQTSAAFVARGAQMLSPIWTDPRGLEACTMRDPGGAIIAPSKSPAAADERADGRDSSPEVLWYGLNTAHVERAKTNYGELFGWDFGAPLAVDGTGIVHPFSWTVGGPQVGSLADIAGRQGVHPHWLFHFAVPALDDALAHVRSLGGKFLPPIALPNGARVAVCDDPQGAAFALQERTS